jgi:reductive dehalogenase
MERIKRVDEPTTLITDEVPRIPRRANFFVRAGFGDLGPKPRQEIQRFVNKYPLSAAMEDVMATQLPLVDGEVASEKAPLPENPEELSKHVKSLCYFLDADVVGICEIPEYAWYSHDGNGKPIRPRHKYAIVLLIDQGFETMAGSSGDDWISGAQSFRAYLKGSTIACTVANYLRKLGHDSRAHTSADGQVLHLPLILLAGLGELSRIGELVLNPFLGPRFKTSIVTTSLPLAVDKPIDFGLQDFCNQCMKCARECPCGAISFGDKVMFNGYEMWKPDAESCVRYRIMNPAGSACGRCMKVCPFNKPSLGGFRFALWLAIRVPALRKLLIRLDDLLEYGQRTPVWKWWLDLEKQEGKLGKPRKVNQRDLRPDRKAPPKQWIALYPVETNPPPDSRDPYPVDRKAARSRSKPD